MFAGRPMVIVTLMSEIQDAARTKDTKPNAFSTSIVALKMCFGLPGRVKIGCILARGGRGSCVDGRFWQLIEQTFDAASF